MIFCISEFVTLIISNIAVIFAKPSLKEAFETATQLNQEVKSTELVGAFSKKIKTSVLDRLSSFFRKT